MQRSSINSVVLLLLIAISLWALVLSANIAAALPLGAGSPRAVSTVRAYYAGVRSYFESGDLAGVRDVVDPGLLSGTATNSNPGDLALYLRGLRGTYPTLTFSVEDLTANNGTVIARIAIHHGPASVVPFSPMTSTAVLQQIDTFQVVEGRIVDWHSTRSAPTLFASSAGPAQPIDVRGSRTLVVARISFSAESKGHVLFQGPALFGIEAGAIQFHGSPFASVFTSGPPEGQVTAPGGEVTAYPSESIFLSGGSLVLSAASKQPVAILAVLFVPVDSIPLDHEIHTPFMPAEQLLVNEQRGQIGHGVTIELLARAAGHVSGSLQFLAGIALLSPGSGMMLERDLEAVVIVPQDGAVSRVTETGASRQVLTNHGTATASVWIAAVRSVSTH